MGVAQQLFLMGSSGWRHEDKNVSAWILGRLTTIPNNSRLEALGIHFMKLEDLSCAIVSYIRL